MYPLQCLNLIHVTVDWNVMEQLLQLLTQLTNVVDNIKELLIAVIMNVLHVIPVCNYYTVSD